jgi:YggT family protein
MIFQILALILQAVFGLFVTALLLRFWMQVFRVGFRNSVGGFVLAVTDWIVLPARRVIPALMGFDLASLICAWLAQAIFRYLLLLLTMSLLGSSSGLVIPYVLIGSLFDLMRYSIYLLGAVVVLQVLISWINPYSTMGPAIEPVLRPFYRRIRRVIPPIRGIDFSPLILLLMLQIFLILLGGLYEMIMRAI